MCSSFHLACLLMTNIDDLLPPQKPGSHIECIYKLLTFGIPEKSLPISTFEASKLDLRAQSAWIEARRKKEALVRTTSKNLDSAFGEYDILFGRGKSFQNHAGNIWCRQLVDDNLSRYELSSKREKTAIANEILETVQAKSGRFLKFENQKWIEVDVATSRDKISHMFRSRRRKLPDEEDEQLLLVAISEVKEDVATPASQALGAPENSTRRIKKTKKQGRREKRPRIDS